MSTPGHTRQIGYPDFDVDRDYQRLRGPLLGLVRRDGWKVTDEEWDATWNTVCANVWRRQQVVEIDFRGEPLNYLLAAAKNELRRQRRSSAGSLVALDDVAEPASREPTLDEQLEHREMLRLIRAIARRRLSPRQRKALALREICGFDYREAARHLGVRPKRYDKELARARAILSHDLALLTAER
jgi:RNA polymerase sigma factor (sigma-70 family)